MDEGEDLVSGVDRAPTLGASPLAHGVETLQMQPCLVLTHSQAQELTSVAVAEMVDDLVERRAEILRNSNADGLCCDDILLAYA